MRGLMGLFLVFFTLLFSPGSVDTTATASQGQAEGVPPGAYLTEYAVKSTTPPLRDHYAVHTRLRGELADPAQSVNKRVYKVGDQETFTVYDLEQKRPYKVNAVAVAVTDHVYMFLDVNSGLSRPTLARLAEDFEGRVYPTTRRFFGEEPTPGVDNDPRLVILNTPLKLAAGYYSSDDGLRQTVNPNSNEREMFYIGMSVNSLEAYLSVLAHEFQHMIYHRSLPNQDLWLNEGSSVLAQVQNGYSSAGYELQFMAQPSTQLNNWACGSCGTPRYYGAGYTWLSFLRDRYGFETVRDIGLNGKNLTSFSAVDHALYVNGQTSQSHETVLKQWVLANYLNRRTADRNYNYLNINSRVDRVTPLTSGPGQTAQLNQFSAGYYSVQGGENGLTLDFKGAPTVKLAGPGAKSGQQAWWSNRGDNSNTSLTRSVDLSSVSSATLKFWTWYDIEPSYDWLYIEVSTDDGKRWEVVPGARYTTDRDPTNKSYGPGLTGQSLASGTDLTDTEETRAVWVQETVDLSKYAGKKIKLRLEYLTDEGYSRQGALFDDFEIPEIGWKDDVEGSENGWEASGFVRSNVTLPQRFWVQVIRRDGPCGVATVADLAKADNGQSCIQELNLDATGAGRQTFPYRQAVVVVAPYAPKTLVPSSFTIKVN